MFDNEDIKYKGRPVKGKRYLAFTVLMIIILSIYIVISDPSEKEIIEHGIKE